MVLLQQLHATESRPGENEDALLALCTHTLLAENCPSTKTASAPVLGFIRPFLASGRMMMFAQIGANYQEPAPICHVYYKRVRSSTLSLPFGFG